MEALIDSIRLAVRDGASDDERRRGLAACRAVADALEGVGVPDAPAASTAVTEPEATVDVTTALVPVAAAPVASNTFAGLSAEQILDLAIAKLRGAVGESEAVPAPAGQSFRLTLVPVPRHR